MKSCRVCGSVYTPYSFDALPFIGIESDEHGVEALVLRRCGGEGGACQNTLSARIITSDEALRILLELSVKLPSLSRSIESAPEAIVDISDRLIDLAYNLLVAFNASTLAGDNEEASALRMNLFSIGKAIPRVIQYLAVQRKVSEPIGRIG